MSENVNEIHEKLSIPKERLKEFEEELTSFLSGIKEKYLGEKRPDKISSFAAAIEDIAKERGFNVAAIFFDDNGYVDLVTKNTEISTKTAALFGVELIKHLRRVSGKFLVPVAERAERAEKEKK